MQKDNSSPRDDRQCDEHALASRLTLTVLAIFALVAAAAFLPKAQLWGVNHLAYYPVPVRLAALAFIALLFVPPIARRLYTALLALSKTLRYGGPRVDIALTAIAVVSVIVFTGLQTSTNLLGDGQLIAQSYDAAWEGNDRVIMRNAKAVVVEEHIAPGATLMYYGAAKVVTNVFNKGPVWGIRLFNCLLGAFFVYVVLVLIRRGPFSTEIRLWLMILALFSTAIQLYFGYVENYTPLLFTGFLYALSGFLILHGRGRLWIVVVLFVVAFYTHIQAILFVPSLVYLILWRLAKQRRPAVERFAGPVLTVVTVAGAIAAGFTRFGRYYLPLRGNEESYGLFSPVHLADVLNEVFMLMPILPLLVAMAWISRSLLRRATARPEKRGEKRTGATGWFAMTAEWHFVFLILAPCFVYLFLFKPEIGMARDWDLFTMTSLGFVPLVLLIINRFLRVTKMQSAAGLFSSPALAIYVILAVAWVGINASPTRSAARFERILEYDKTHASYAYENLAIFYHESGQVSKAVEVMETACDISRNPRQYVRLAMYYNEEERVDEAIDLMYQTLGNHPDFTKARFYLVSLLEKQKKYDDLLEVVTEGTKYHPEDAIYWFYLGEVSILKGDIEEGLAAHRKCLTLDPPEKARRRCLEQIEKHSSEEE
jgi:Tfp pilus assembly protein PilF